MGYQLFATSACDKSEDDLVSQLLVTRRALYGDGVVVLDCGANIGVHTIVWARLMQGWGTVLAIEAQERIFYALAGNITLNNCFNARALWKAVGAHSGTIEVPIVDYFTPTSFGSLEIKPLANPEHIGQTVDYKNTQTAQMVSIDDMGLDRIDFIKIDIEGMEMEALAGAMRSIQKFKPMMLIEKIKTNAQSLNGFLSDQGYQSMPCGVNVLAIHESDPASKYVTYTPAQKA